MLQRKQTIFLLLALVITVVCLCMQIGSFEPQKTMIAPSRLYNLWIQGSDGTRKFSVWPLFTILLLTCSIAFFAIFMYKKRSIQSLMCVINIVLIVVWYVSYFLFGYILAGKIMSFHPFLTAILPFAALVFYVLARRGIIADEKLVKAADRIR